MTNSDRPSERDLARDEARDPIRDQVRDLDRDLRDAARDLLAEENTPDLVPGVLAALPPRPSGSPPVPVVRWPRWAAAASLLATLTFAAMQWPEAPTSGAPQTDGSDRTIDSSPGSAGAPLAAEPPPTSEPAVASATAPGVAPPSPPGSRPGLAPVATNTAAPLDNPALSLMQGAPAAVLAWLPEPGSQLLSRTLEQPLLDEVDGLSRDAQRAAAALLGPLVKSWTALRGGLDVDVSGPL